MNIDQAAAALEAAKIAEAQANRARLDAEANLLALAEARDEGRVTLRGQQYKATVTFGVNRTVDAAALAAVRDAIPEALFEQAVEYAPKLRLAGVRYLMLNEPETYAVLAQAITAKPAKPSVRVEMVQEEREAA